MAVKCQFMGLGWRLRRSCQALASVVSFSMPPMRRSAHCLEKMENSISATFSQEPCLGVKWKLSLRRMRLAS